jgi:hypothetical protein
LGRTRYSNADYGSTDTGAARYYPSRNTYAERGAYDPRNTYAQPQPQRRRGFFLFGSR